VATLDLRDCVMAGRWNGRGTLGALGRIAETYGVSLKWAKKLFFNDGHVAMSAERRRLLALRAADFLERVADDLDRKAALLRALAAEIATALRRSKSGVYNQLGRQGVWQRHQRPGVTQPVAEGDHERARRLLALEVVRAQAERATAPLYRHWPQGTWP
jgi:hypothetical protein